MKPSICIAIPTYNESENILTLLDTIQSEVKKIKEFTFRVIIIDDNSPDGTADLVKNHKSSLPTDVIVNKHKGGLAKAYITAYKYAIANHFDAVLQMDGDLSHDPKYIKDFIKYFDSHDMIIGSRYIKNGGVKNWDWKRIFISKYGNLYSRLILSAPIKDLTGGFNLYKTNALKMLNLESITAQGYFFQIEIKYRLLQHKATYIEVPIVFIDRILGKSKFTSSIFFEALWKPIKTRFSK